MRTKLRGIIAIFLCAVSILICAACGKNNEPPRDESGILPSGMEIAEDAAKGGNLMLASGGSTNYKIVIADAPSQAEEKAASQLADYLKQSTGADFPVVHDSAAAYDTSAYYISVGKTALLEKSGAQISEETLGSEGLYIDGDGNLIFLTGAKDMGTLYAVYEFLAKEISFEVYYTDEIYFNKVKEVPVYVYENYVSVPSVENRWVGCGMFKNADESSLMRLQYGYTDGSIDLNGNMWGTWAHSISTQFGVTEDAWGKIHSEWFGGGQVCMTQQSLIDYLAGELIKKVQQNPVAKYWMLGGADNHTSCTCKGCRDSNAVNGGSGGTYVIFLNKIAEKVEKWQIDNDIDREIVIVGLAYQGYSDDPAVKNETTGEYELVNENVRCRSNVGIMYAPINACHGHSYGDPECTNNINGGLNDQFYGWAETTEHFMLWLYNTDFQNYFLSFNDWGSLKRNAEIFDELGVEMIFSQSCKNGRTSFDALRLYLRSKLWWDPTLDYNTLVDDFFDNYYKVCADEMREYFDAIMANYMKIFADYETSGCVGYNNIGTEYYSADKWDYSLLMKHKDILARAYEAVENSSETEAVKEKLRERILVEEVCVNAFLVYNCEAYFTPAEYEQLRTKFYADCADMGILYKSETTVV